MKFGRYSFSLFLNRATSLSCQFINFFEGGRVPLTLAGPIGFLHTRRPRGGGGYDPPLAVSPLVELARRGKNERVRRYETQRLVPDFKVLGQPVTSEVRSSAPRYGSVFGE